MKNVELILNGKRAVISFISRYREQNDYEVYQDGRTGRVSKCDDGTITSHSDNFSVTDAMIAVLAHDAADTMAFIHWQNRQGERS